MEEGEEKRESKVGRRESHHEDVVRQFVDRWSVTFAARGSHSSLLALGHPDRRSGMVSHPREGWWG